MVHLKDWKVTSVAESIADITHRNTNPFATVVQILPHALKVNAGGHDNSCNNNSIFDLPLYKWNTETVIKTHPEKLFYQIVLYYFYFITLQLTTTLLQHEIHVPAIL